jgi:uroporphyrinogen decarboxylase
MKINMRKWFDEIVASEKKTPIPILSFPATQLMNITVRDLIASSEKMADAICKVAERTGSAVALGMMDLSVEAEAFGAEIHFSDDEVPTVKGRIVTTREDADNLKIPSVDAGRAGKYFKAIELAAGRITDRPIFSCMIGPFSLAGRLMDVSEAMMNCYDDPDMVHAVLEKITTYLIDFAKRYKSIGANGHFLAEPVAGILSPSMIDEFSSPYCKRIVEAIQDDYFSVVYHNCGNTLPQASSIMKIGAAAYHFGNTIDLEKMFDLVPEGTMLMGNIGPAGQFRNGTPQSIREATLELMGKCSRFASFIPSSGCDIPPLASWENYDSFRAAVKDFYAK